MVHRARQRRATRAIAVAVALVTVLVHQSGLPFPVRIGLVAAALLPWAPRAELAPRLLWTPAALAPAAALYLAGDQFAVTFLMLTLAATAFDAPAALVLATGGSAEVAVLVPFALHPQMAALLLTSGLALSLLAGWMLRSQVALVEQLDAARADLQRQALADERRHIARDVHDLVAHSLTVVMLQMTAARLRVRRDPRAAEEMLAETERLGRQALVEVRRLVELLRDDESATRPPPGAADLPALVSRLREAGMDVRLETEGDVERISDSAGLTLYRVAQEALSNAGRHAPGAAVRVRLQVGEGETTLRVRDWGTGAGRGPAGPPAGHGLRGMHERAALLGGTVRAEPAEPGWEVECVIPT
ncbi:MAG TPA: sensor histidine kinase [Terriglobales bacterium]|nr:sensor histidine kinase [Terriglobales bacterium]